MNAHTHTHAGAAALLPWRRPASPFSSGAGTGVPFHWHGAGFSEVIYGRKVRSQPAVMLEVFRLRRIETESDWTKNGGTWQSVPPETVNSSGPEPDVWALTLDLQAVPPVGFWFRRRFKHMNVNLVDLGRSAEHPPLLLR